MNTREAAKGRRVRTRSNLLPFLVALLPLHATARAAGPQMDMSPRAPGRLGGTNAAAIRAWMEQVRDENGLPGLSVAVATDGRIVFSDGVGYAELDNRLPATGGTVHNVGSVSKVIAAIPIMQLVEQGKVALDGPIQRYVPYFPEKGKAITLRQVLTHTSGIRHYKDGEFGPYRLQEMIYFESFEESTRRWRDDPLVFEPGTYWMYSSYAFNLLHGLVESVTGIGFEAYLRRFVWEPAGMLSTQFDVPSRIVHNRGRGYERNQRGILVNTDYADVSYKYAGGGILSTVEDLVRFGTALNDGTLLKPETVADMYRVQIGPVVKAFSARGEPQPLNFGQALAWRVQTDRQGRRFTSHTGTVKGTRTYVGNYPDLNIVVALQANALPFDSEVYGQALLQMLVPPAHPRFDRVPGTPVTPATPARRGR
ncbi:MAG: beta-lactamase family protein [Gemmatimonadetes bacterium]|nr:beta-lactamase family protein [Gemmatimonadota bacterium]